MLHDLITALVAAALLWAICTPRLPTGIFPTAGLGTLFVATVWSMDDYATYAYVVNTMIGGLGLIGVGVVWRIHRGHDRSKNRAPR